MTASMSPSTRVRSGGQCGSERRDPELRIRRERGSVSTPTEGGSIPEVARLGVVGPYIYIYVDSPDHDPGGSFENSLESCVGKAGQWVVTHPTPGPALQYRFIVVAADRYSLRWPPGVLQGLYGVVG